jgi:hypothetical protein
MTKLVAGGRYAWTIVQNGRLLGGMGGSYSTDEGTYTETVMYAVGDNDRLLIGKSFKFTWTIDGGKWHHKATLEIGNARQEINEVWERVP